MLNKYNNFLNNNSYTIFGDIPLKLKGSYKFEKYGNNRIYLKISINLGYFIINVESIKDSKVIEKELFNFINKYFTNIEKYELEELYELANSLINEGKNEIDLYSYLDENIIEEFQNTIDYEILLKKYPNEIEQISNIYIKIYKYLLNNIKGV